MRVRTAAALSSVIVGVAVGALLFVAAGTADWPDAWTWLALFIAGGVASSLFAPEAVLRERMRGPVRSGQGSADRAFVVVFGTLTAAWFALVSLDHRFGWSSVAPVGHVVGALLFIAANAAIVWVLRANPYASASVRVAADQVVATSGPYRIVRHPMYASVILYLPGTALLLGSVYSSVASIALIAALGVRTSIEERALRDGLAGYAEYAARVRWRLVPGVW